MTQDEKNAYKSALTFVNEGEWERAHSIVDALHTDIAAHIHAYLHRVEGDIWNADYWYRRAEKVRPEISVEEEWQNLMGLYAE